APDREEDQQDETGRACTDEGPRSRRDGLDDGLGREVVQPEEHLHAEEREDGGRLLGARRAERARGRLPGTRGFRGAGAHGLLDAGARGPAGGGEPLLQSVAFRRRSALPMTETE